LPQPELKALELEWLLALVWRLVLALPLPPASWLAQAWAVLASVVQASPVQMLWKAQQPRQILPRSPPQRTEFPLARRVLPALLCAADHAPRAEFPWIVRR
jgi:hypothetical protein